MTNVPKLRGIFLPAGPDYRDMADFDVFNPFYDIPVSVDLVGAWFLSTQINNPLNNHADLTKPLLKVGNPVVGAKGASCSDGNYFNTGIPVGTSMASSPAVTLITVSRNPSTTVDAWVFSNYTGNNGVSSDSILMRKDNQVESYTSSGSGLASAVVSRAGAGAATDRAVTVSAFGPGVLDSSVYNPTTDSLTTGSRTGITRNINTPTNYAIGVRPGMTGNGQSEVSVVLAYKSRLSAGDQLRVARYLRTQFGTRYNLW